MEELPHLHHVLLEGKAGLDGRAPRGQLIEDGDVKVAVHCHGERAGDRGGAHDEDVGVKGGILLPEPAPLVDTEAVLLVDHRHTEGVEADIVLDQDVGADEDVHLARLHECGDPLLLPLPHRPSEEGDGGLLSPEHPREGIVVLLREDLRRCHHTGLHAAVRRLEHRKERHDRLPRSHIALQETIHLMPRGDILADLPEDALLRTGELKGEPLLIKGHEVVPQRSEDEAATLCLPLGVDQSHSEAEVEELLQLEPPLCRLQLGHIGGEVHRIKCLSSRHQPILAEEVAGEGLGDLPLHPIECPPDGTRERLAVQPGALHPL